MRPVMAFPAVGILAVHLDTMWLPMTGFAFRNQLMLVLVAVNTLQVMMLGPIGRQGGNNIAMAAGTPIIGNLSTVLDGSWLMCRMTLQT